MTGSGTGEPRLPRERLPDEPTPLRRVLGGLLLVLAACLLVASTGLTYGLTSEYGFSPNDDPSGDLVQAALGHALAGLLVAGLAAGGLELATRLPTRRRLLVVAAVFVAAFVVLGLGMALGQRALDARCSGPERSSTGAC